MTKGSPLERRTTLVMMAKKSLALIAKMKRSLKREKRKRLRKRRKTTLDYRTR